MPPLTPELRRARAQKAARTRWHGGDAETTPEIEALDAGRVEKALAVLRDGWQHATAEQKDQLRRLWQGTG